MRVAAITQLVSNKAELGAPSAQSSAPSSCLNKTYRLLTSVFSLHLLRPETSLSTSKQAAQLALAHPTF